MADPRETQFQRDVVNYLRTHGWQLGSSANYDKKLALYPEDVLGFYQTAFPDEWQKFQVRYPKSTEAELLKSVSEQLGKPEVGTLAVLRHGFKDRGAIVRLAQFRPDHDLNPETLVRYTQNRLRVVPELVYSPHGAKGRIDLTLFVNGIPTATLELKSEFNQAVEEAKEQYRTERLPEDPVTRKPEPLLRFKRGALVHFAMSQHEVWMSTKLAGGHTRFLPFNLGTPDGGKGNPIKDGYDTSYLWEEVFQPDNWLRLLGRFIHLEKQEVEDAAGNKSVRETLIFPRYHQWDVINKLLGAALQEGPGQRYLIQHSAGSGKSNSIAWLSHQLASLYDQSNEKIFSSIIVITDRTVLDAQLQETIYQFDHQTGVVARVSRDEGDGSKSEQLVEALDKSTPVIIVTLQTFPYVLSAIREQTTLKGKNFAVIADEAHSSQSGRTAVGLRSVLLAEKVDPNQDLSGEDVMNLLLEARRGSDSISYFAFTATPKGKTLELFGRPPDPEAPLSNENKPLPFHVYTMRQAIEEGFILDVLQNYTTYEHAYALGQRDPNSQVEVPGRWASRKLAEYQRLHPHNIAQKVAVIAEHFRSRIAPLLGGQAKAMVVTSGRRDAVRYKLALDKYVRDNSYDDLSTLVAFSGDVKERLSDLEGFDTSLAGSLGKATTVRDGAGLEFTESSMNPKARGDLRKAFDTNNHQVMIVANKFQTGFSQAKLVAMYVDKKLSGVDAVQTLSRLNRTHPGKTMTFVLDFVNRAEDIQAAFQPYYQTTMLDTVSDPNLVYELFDKLKSERIYMWDEVVAFSEVFFDPKGKQADLTTHARPAAQRFREQYRNATADLEGAKKEEKRAREAGNDVAAGNAVRDAQEAEKLREALELFRKNLGSYLRFYEFMSQIIPYDDPELERLNVFGRHLLPLLRSDDDITLELSDVTLVQYRLAKQLEQDIKLKQDTGTGLSGITSLGSGTARGDNVESLSAVIERLNTIFGSGLNDNDLVNYAQTISAKVQENETVMRQVHSNTAEQVMHGDFPGAVQDAVLESSQKHQEMMQRVLGDKDTASRFSEIILELLLTATDKTMRR